jgi:hypothetical protein
MRDPAERELLGAVRRTHARLTSRKPWDDAEAHRRQLREAVVASFALFEHRRGRPPRPADLRTERSRREAFEDAALTERAVLYAFGSFEAAVDAAELDPQPDTAA